MFRPLLTVTSHLQQQSISPQLALVASLVPSLGIIHLNRAQFCFYKNNFFFLLLFSMAVSMYFICFSLLLVTQLLSANILTTARFWETKRGMTAAGGGGGGASGRRRGHNEQVSVCRCVPDAWKWEQHQWNNRSLEPGNIKVMSKWLKLCLKVCFGAMTGTPLGLIHLETKNHSTRITCGSTLAPVSLFLYTTGFSQWVHNGSQTYLYQKKNNRSLNTSDWIRQMWVCWWWFFFFFG